MASTARRVGDRGGASPVTTLVGRRGRAPGGDTAGLRSDAATCARATPASAAASTRTTRARSCSTTIIRVSDPTRRARLRRLPASIATRPATGVARVVCYSPRHDVTLAELDVDGVDALLATWQEQMRELAGASRRPVRADLREQG